MSKNARPGTWPGAIVVMDNIPIVCPICGHKVSIAASLSEDGQRFEAKPCPHCDTPMSLEITAESDEGGEEIADERPLEKMEVSIGVKNLPHIPECLYRITNLESVSDCIDRVINILCTIFANYATSPNSIKDMYIREIISDITPEGKKTLIEALEAQIEQSKN